MVFSCCKSRPIELTVQYDRHLAYLAGDKEGMPLIGKAEQERASLAQKHPFGNKINAMSSGIVAGAAVTATALMANLFRDSSALNSIIGSGAEKVCIPCGINVVQLKNHFFSENYAWKDIGTYFDVVNQCGNGQFLGGIGCRLINSMGNAVHTATQYPFLLAGCFGIVLGWVALMSLESAQKGEIKQEEALIEALKNKYDGLAQRLKERAAPNSLETDKIKALAKKILHDRKSINQSIVNLGLPSISSVKKAHDITRNLFTTALEIDNLG